MHGSPCGKESDETSCEKPRRSSFGQDFQEVEETGAVFSSTNPVASGTHEELPLTYFMGPYGLCLRLADGLGPRTNCNSY
ncbi:unnamed protein product [Cylicocyclus nassatus]|uniref:Uncharacterized protein n=1 Tax=Cylicocyclus nassatus TaxID=53992 RepID=A0AA36H1X7_CYLNA|nr:unnamed protein product [Cylicocyclus nassatus]